MNERGDNYQNLTDVNAIVREALQNDQYLNFAHTFGAEAHRLIARQTSHAHPGYDVRTDLVERPAGGTISPPGRQMAARNALAGKPFQPPRLVMEPRIVERPTREVSLWMSLLLEAGPLVKAVPGALTRAVQLMHLFSTISPEELIPEGSSLAFKRVIKNFEIYVKTPTGVYMPDTSMLSSPQLTAEQRISTYVSMVNDSMNPQLGLRRPGLLEVGEAGAISRFIELHNSRTRDSSEVDITVIGGQKPFSTYIGNGKDSTRFTDTFGANRSSDILYVPYSPAKADDYEPVINLIDY